MGMNPPYCGPGVGGFYNYERQLVRQSDPSRNYVLVSADTDYPLTAAQVKEHLKIDTYNSESDGYITQLIRSVLGTAEKCMRMEVQLKTYRFFLPRFPIYDPESFIEIRKRPLVSIHSIQILQPDGTYTTVDPSTYYLTNASSWPRIYKTSTWPDVYVNRPDAIKIEFDCGIAAPNAASCPVDIQLAMLNHASLLYEQRGDWGSADIGVALLIQNLPSYSQLVYNSYRVSNR